ncbi:hypothetical protein ACPUD5_26165, partial [Escherichia coli]|uniref:hypothetical protein n=1 Tax=Escherichia coli TaxID=562 RepID=UPI003CC6C667
RYRDGRAVGSGSHVSTDQRGQRGCEARERAASLRRDNVGRAVDRDGNVLTGAHRAGERHHLTRDGCGDGRSGQRASLPVS